jgi:hypothetical protein
MSLSRKIADALANRPNQPALIQVQDQHASFSIDARVLSSLAVEANSLEFKVQRPNQPDYSITELEAWAKRIESRVTYLMEPLVLVEADAEGLEVEMRSQSPTPRDGLRAFFQARLTRRGVVNIHRLAFNNTSRQRERVPFQLTREVLERLADDLVASAL